MREQPAKSRVEGNAARPHVVIISGLSGAGKTAASKLLEDVGFRVVDNLPAELLRHLAQLVANESGQFERLALVLDARSGDPALAYREAVHALAGRGISAQVFF